jgi:HEAT repeat protein
VKLEFDERDRQSALGDLASPDAEVRRLAVERSVALPVDEAIGVLVDRLGDPSWRVRKAAVERLIAMPDPQAWVARLIAALGDGEDPGRRNAAVEALVHGGRRVVSDLVAAIGSHDAGVRKLLIDTLAGIADPGSEAVLVAALSDPDANVRAAAAEALGALGGAAAQRALRECAAQGDEDRLVRLAALRTLATLDAQVPARELCPLLDDAILRPAALDLLGRSDDAVAPVLLKWLGSESRVSRMAAVRSLLLRIARSDDAEAVLLVEAIREQAASLPAADDAIATLASPDLGARLVAMQFLGIVRDPRAVVPILRAVRDDALRDVGLSTLEEFGPLAEAELDAAWPELELAARCDACRLFARTRGAQSAERLLAALEDPAHELRAEAERAVGRRRLATALPALLRRLEAISGEDDPEADEEAAAVTEALCELAAPVKPGAETHPEAHAILDALTSRLGGAPEPVRLAIAHVLGRAGRPSDAGAMIRLLEDPSAPVRRAAVVALARLEGAAASEPLRLALADESASVRIAAASALERERRRYRRPRAPRRRPRSARPRGGDARHRPAPAPLHGPRAARARSCAARRGARRCGAGGARGGRGAARDRRAGGARREPDPPAPRARAAEGGRGLPRGPRRGRGSRRDRPARRARRVGGARPGGGGPGGAARRERRPGDPAPDRRRAGLVRARRDAPRAREARGLAR